MGGTPSPERMGGTPSPERMGGTPSPERMGGRTPAPLHLQHGSRRSTASPSLGEKQEGAWTRGPPREPGGSVGERERARRGVTRPVGSGSAFRPYAAGMDAVIPQAREPEHLPDQSERVSMLQPPWSNRMVENLRPVAGQRGAPHHAILEYPNMGTRSPKPTVLFRKRRNRVWFLLPSGTRPGLRGQVHHSLTTTASALLSTGVFTLRGTPGERGELAQIDGSCPLAVTRKALLVHISSGVMASFIVAHVDANENGH
jgi:hypothetical protein